MSEQKKALDRVVPGNKTFTRTLAFKHGMLSKILS